MEVVLNKCFGCFSVSKEVCEILGLKDPYQHIDRMNYNLIKCVRELGDRANGSGAKLRVVDLTEDCTDWEINEYDGYETITYVVDGRLYHI